MEKLIHYFAHKREKTVEAAQAKVEELKRGEVDEKAKIKGAIRTDFVLSAEIIVITLGVVASRPFATQALVLSAIALLMTVGVYGLVACIVKLDDLGLYLSRKGLALGRGILWAAPFLMKGLSIVGTAAMFLVGGQILVHGIPPLLHWIEHLVEPLGAWGKAVITVFDGLFGIAAGGLIVLALKPFLKGRH